jgi:hypothetical protein
MDAAVKPTWRYLRRPLTDTAQTYRSDERTTGYTLHLVASSTGKTVSAKAQMIVQS